MKIKLKEILIGVLVAVLALVIGCVIYINDNYEASEAAMALIETPAEDIHLIVDEAGRMVFEPDDATSGIIFYPGGKVEAESYAPLLSALAEEGILTVLVPMPVNLAVLDPDAAEGIVEEFSYIENWYMAGHSLGGAMAASYLAEQTESDYFKGLILLAAYSTEDLTKTDFIIFSPIHRHRNGHTSQCAAHYATLIFFCFWVVIHAVSLLFRTLIGCTPPKNWEILVNILNFIIRLPRWWLCL